MKGIVLSVVAVVYVLGANAQGIARVTEELARADFSSEASIEVRYEGDAAAALRSADQASGRTRVMAYRVSLFRDNSQNAGANARAVRAQFAEMYPAVPVELIYENPYFKVEAGPFVDRIDAVALCGKVLTVFKGAVVVQQETSLEKIVTTERTEAEMPTVALAPDEIDE